MFFLVSKWSIYFLHLRKANCSETFLQTLPTYFSNFSLSSIITPSSSKSSVMGILRFHNKTEAWFASFPWRLLQGTLLGFFTYHFPRAICLHERGHCWWFLQFSRTLCRHKLSSCRLRWQFVRAIDEGLTLETAALKLFTVANLRYQLNW